MAPRKKISRDGDLASKEGRSEAAAGKKSRAKTGTKKAAGKSGKYSLSRERILAAAMAIVDQEGFAALSMRRLGKKLGVDPMSVYYHVPNKSALLDTLVEVVMTSIDLEKDNPDLPAEERLLLAAHTYRNSLMAHPNLMRAAMCLAPRTPAAMKPVEALMQIFKDAGFNIVDSFLSMNILASYVRGAVIRELTEEEKPFGDEPPQTVFATAVKELSPEEFPNLVQIGSIGDCCEVQAMFDRGARALIRGLLQMYGNNKEGN